MANEKFDPAIHAIPERYVSRYSDANHSNNAYREAYLGSTVARMIEDIAVIEHVEVELARALTVASQYVASHSPAALLSDVELINAALAQVVPHD